MITDIKLITKCVKNSLLIETIAQIVPLIQFKFTFCQVTSNVANNFEVLTIKFGVHVNKAVCSLTRWLICLNFVNVFSKVREVGLKDTTQAQASCTCLSVLIGSLMIVV